MGARQSAEVGKALVALSRKGADIREVAARFGLALSTLYRARNRQKPNAKIAPLNGGK